MKKTTKLGVFSLTILVAVWAILLLSSIAVAGDQLVFGVVPKTLDNPGFLIAKRGADARAAELGDVDIYWTASNTANAAEQVIVIEGLIQRRVDGLLINSNGPEVDDVINRAMAAGIPVVAWDSDSPDSQRISYVGSDDFLGGQMAAELMKEATEGQGPLKIAILTGVPGVYNLRQRDLGFIEGMADTDAEIIITVPCYDDIALSVEVVENTIRGNPEINAWFFDGPWPLLVNPESLPNLVNAVKSGDMTVVSYDTLPQQLPWVQEGLVYGLVGQKYFGWGYQGVSVLYSIVKYGKEYPEFVDMGIDVVTKDGGEGRFTAEEFQTKWDIFDFTEEPL